MKNKRQNPVHSMYVDVIESKGPTQSKRLDCNALCGQVARAELTDTATTFTKLGSQ